MKPKIFRVRPGSDYDLNDSNQLYVVDFLLDCTIVWMRIRDDEGIYEAERQRCQRVLEAIGMLLSSITTDRSISLKSRIKVDVEIISKMMVNQLVFFSARTQKRSLSLIKEGLKDYL